jgi:sugar-specific transcriptional regulator TrmB
VSLGFTALEAEIYTFLLQEAPVTGYRVAQALRKPAPNIYKAIESLEAKGAVMVDEGASRLCRPVPAAELLSHLERRFRRVRDRAARSLADLSGDTADDRVYRLRSSGQVLERARNMLGRSREVALVDCFPLPLASLRADLEAAGGRGVDVAVKAYEPIALEHAHVVLDSRGGAALERWPGQWINVVVDGSEHLVAFLTRDGQGVHQAIWSGSVWLSWVYHGAVAAEIILDAVENRVAAGGTLDDVRGLLGTLARLHAYEARGYRTLRRRFSRSRSARTDGDAAREEDE